MFKRIATAMLALVLVICLIPSQVSAAQTMTYHGVEDTVNGQYYTVVDESGASESFSYTVPEDGAAVLVFYSSGCGNSQSLMSQLNDCSWLDSEYLNVVAVECPSNSIEHLDGVMLTQFRQQYIPNAGDNVKFYFNKGGYLLWAYFGLISNEYSLTYPLVLVITEENGVPTVQYADMRMNSIQSLEGSLCARAALLHSKCVSS